MPNGAARRPRGRFRTLVFWGQEGRKGSQLKKKNNKININDSASSPSPSSPQKENAPARPPVPPELLRPRGGKPAVPGMRVPRDVSPPQRPPERGPCPRGSLPVSLPHSDTSGELAATRPPLGLHGRADLNLPRVLVTNEIKAENIISRPPGPPADAAVVTALVPEEIWFSSQLFPQQVCKAGDFWSVSAPASPSPACLEAATGLYLLNSRAGSTKGWCSKAFSFFLHSFGRLFLLFFFICEGEKRSLSPREAAGSEFRLANQSPMNTPRSKLHLNLQIPRATFPQQARGFCKSFA